MDAVNNINRSAAPPSTVRHPARSKRQPGHADPQQVDLIEFSSTAVELARRDDLTHVRAGLIDRVRAQIADGTYQSPEKINTIVELLVEQLANLDVQA